MFGSQGSRRDRDLEARLRAERATPGDELVRAISRRVGPRPTGVPRLALAGGLSAVMLLALGSVGGISYAANAAKEAAHVVRKAVAPKAGQKAIVVKGISAGGDQYQPGYGFGDPNHNHAGPPGQERAGGEAAPPLRARAAGPLAKTVNTTVSIDEQAALFISVVDSAGTPLLLTQESKRGGSKVGAGIAGPQTKFIRYTLLVPRAFPLALRIPANLLEAGKTYSIRIVAIDADGNRSELRIPFVA